MCIDKLEIRFEERTGGLGHIIYREHRPNVDEGIAPDPRRIDVDDLRRALPLGYEITERSSSSGRRHYALLHVVNERGEKVGITIKAGNVMAAGRDTPYLYVKAIIANPSWFPCFEGFWALMQLLDGPNGANRLIERGYIQRIDYACDYRIALNTIMRGLYVSKSQTLLAYDDFTEGDPYAEYRWGAGHFSSFKVNAGNKSLKVYDKGREELKKLHTLERRLTGQIAAGRNAEGHGSDDFDGEDDEDAEDAFSLWDDAFLAEPDLRAQLERLRSNIAQIAAAPRTRIELSLNTPAVIRDTWGLESGKPRLSMLPGHLDNIRFGRFTPFRGVLLNTIETRGAHLTRRTLEAQRLHHEISLGLLMNVAKNMGRRFWDRHGRFFEIYSWSVQAQPTAVFKMRLYQWMTPGNELSLGAVIPPEHLRSATARPQTSRWPMERTYCTAQRMAARATPPAA